MLPNKNNFLSCVTTLIPSEFKDGIDMIHCNLSAILRVYNSSQEVGTEKLDALCKETYEFIINAFPWVNITPTLHKLLAHCTELILNCNNGFGLKQCFSTFLVLGPLLRKSIMLGHIAGCHSGYKKDNLSFIIITITTHFESNMVLTYGLHLV